VIRIVLFDIDGTLLLTGGAGRRAFLAAAEDVLEKPVDDSKVAFAGQTDQAIMKSLLAQNGFPDHDPALSDTVFARYLVHLDGEIERGAFRLCPGIRELLDAMERDGEFLTGLLTGNIELAAHRKLSHVGIDSAFKFGAFGSDHIERDCLVPIARARAGRVAGCAAADAPVVVIGDTPLDVQCARAGGARAFAVATGLYDRDGLAACKPDVLCDDLSDTPGVIRILRRLTSEGGS
jgi:phosphoglycolate phosphatase